MKKYNTPEMKVAIFNRESILTESTNLEAFNTFYNNNGTVGFTTTWEEINTKGVEVSF